VDKSTVRVRPLRFAFLVEPSDKASLKSVFELNSALWGGAYNFVIPVFKGVPRRYRIPYFRTPVALDMRKGLIEAFQPDFLVEMKAGAATGLEFSQTRVISYQDILAVDDQGRRKIGIDLRSVCDELYNTTYKFVLRHPPEVVIPACKTKRFDLFFAAAFGHIPDTPELKPLADMYLGALNGKRELFAPVEFPKLFNQKYVYPIRVTIDGTQTRRQNYMLDAKMFYMDETSPYDLIDYWNFRALGWPIRPLPVSLAPQLTEYCEQFVKDVYRPFTPPNQGFFDASFLCSPGLNMDDLQEYVKGLTRPAPDAITLDPRVPRLWEDWGRGADHAKPQLVIAAEKSVDAEVIGGSLHVDGSIPEFIENDRFASHSTACANVLESVPNGAPVIPWRSEAMSSLLHDMGEEKTWASREGIVFTAGWLLNSRLLRMPSPFNVFAAYFKHSGYELTLSPSGRTCQQIIAALGDLKFLGIVARSREILRFLDQMAHEDVEIDVEDGTGKKRKLKKPYAPYSRLREAVQRSNTNHDSVVNGHISALLRYNVLKVGMSLSCTECLHTSWFSLEDIKPTVKCPRCMAEFQFPADQPPRDSWAYKVSGPFAAENYAHGSYCVAAALRYFTEKNKRRATYIPSFQMKDTQGKELEADFGMFVAPTHLDHDTAPYLVFGECKSFNRLEAKDFARARALAKAFPGAILCFATFNESFSPKEIKALKSIVLKGRRHFDVGRIRNPVILLTARELFGQFKLGGYDDQYGPNANYARMVVIRGDLQELADLTQQIYLDMQPYHEWYQEKHREKVRKMQAKQAAGAAATSLLLPNPVGP
jgi:hypothetical protein